MVMAEVKEGISDVAVAFGKPTGISTTITSFSSIAVFLFALKRAPGINPAIRINGKLGGVNHYAVDPIIQMLADSRAMVIGMFQLQSNLTPI